MSGSIDKVICSKCNYNGAVRDTDYDTGGGSIFCPECGWEEGYKEKTDQAGELLLDENGDCILEPFAGYVPDDWPALNRNKEAA